MANRIHAKLFTIILVLIAALASDRGLAIGDFFGIGYSFRIDGLF